MKYVHTINGHKKPYNAIIIVGFSSLKRLSHSGHIVFQHFRARLCTYDIKLNKDRYLKASTTKVMRAYKHRVVMLLLLLAGESPV